MLGHLLKEVVLARAFETWKARRAADEIYRRYRDPIVLAALDLTYRLSEICREYPTDFLSSDLLQGACSSPNQDSARDSYFRRYKLQSTVYRLGSLLGWLELYRQEVTFFEVDKSKISRGLDGCLNRFRSALADGFLNDAADWHRWRDALIFREEQRAVGESLIRSLGGRMSVVSYGTYVAIADGDPARPERRWLTLILNFFADPSPPVDFRWFRYHRLIVELLDLVRILAPKRLDKQLEDVYGNSKQVLDQKLLPSCGGAEDSPS